VYEEICVESLGACYVKSECGLTSNDDFETKCQQESMFIVMFIYLMILGYTVKYFRMVNV